MLQLDSAPRNTSSSINSAAVIQLGLASLETCKSRFDKLIQDVDYTNQFKGVVGLFVHVHADGLDQISQQNMVAAAL